MKILFVVMVQSVHVARWISQLDGTGWDVHLFPSMWPARVHAELSGVTLHGVGLLEPVDLPDGVRVAGLYPFRRGGFRAEELRRRWFAGPQQRPRQLAAVIRRIRPDIVHTIEMQHGGYLTDESRRYVRGRFPKWIYSCWGNDIYYFGRLEEHKPRIRSVLSHCDYFTADCYRDSRLAREWGFQGRDHGYFPGPGGFHLERMRDLRAGGPVAARRAIAIKGYDHWGGRALNALKAVHRCADVLGDYELVVYSAPPHVRSVVRHIAAVIGLNISVMPSCSHDDMVRLMGRSRISIGNSISDGTPNSMLEAMAMGAFPVQSDTVSTAEWIEDGKNGLLVDPEDPGTIESALRQALSDDALMEEAARRNTELTDRRIARDVVVPRVRSMYAQVRNDP